MVLRHHGYRSDFELSIALGLRKRNIDFEYETHKIDYVRHATYIPDFCVNDFFIEAKGLFNAADRGKHLLIKKQHPELDIRFLFMKATNKLYKGSKTTYAGWCERYGFKWCQGFIPQEWLDE
mgnify:FL=1|jgi:hypothetical protein|tara:strand:+ start:38100 stop:38465 length:366 start_codon:yes stop_codon:yes gene_type:complete